MKAYDLSSVIVHIGSSMVQGHYAVMVRTLTGWQYIGDAEVHTVTLQDVLGSEAYILMYSKHECASEMTHIQ